MSHALRFEVTAVGEMLLRLSVPGGSPLESAVSLDVGAAGAEGNALAALAAVGRRCGLATRLPDHPLGRLVARQLRAAGVDLEAVEWCQEGRLGAFFVELAQPPRPTRVVYDRADSCASRLDASTLDWDYLLDTQIVHLAGVTAAVSPSCRELVREARARAHGRGICVSFDVNYREALWSPKEAQAALLPLLEDVEVLFCSTRDATRVFGLSGDPEQVAEQLGGHTGAGAVVVSSGARGAVLWRDGASTVAAAAPPVQILDRLGAGDALAAGVFDGWLDGDLDVGLRRGVALAALALTHRGDFVITTRRELDELVADGSSAEVLR